MSEPAKLSPREHQCAALAAAGLADRQIAQRLGVSTRTVSNYLSSAYAKLGVRGRGELDPRLNLDGGVA